MLRKPKILEIVEAPTTHVDVFVERYEHLRKWALQLSDYDVNLSDDLLHDFFLHFTTSKPDLTLIDNLDGYLYVIMRNLHLSQVRRANRTPMRALSVVEFDTIDLGMWASDPRERIRLLDQLGAVCHYACVRKETSKAGSVLILRFFHGYYPEEIARVMRVSRPAVKERLRLARAEAKVYVEDPERLGFIDREPAKGPRVGFGTGAGELRNQLRSAIFRSCSGEHFGVEALKSLYRFNAGDGPECGALAHLVSCQTCLDEVNNLLDIPALASRYPEDTVGKDPGRKGGSGGGGAGGGDPKMLDSYLARKNDLFYHEPQELCVSANGLFQGLQRVAADKNEMTLVIDTAESLGFVEVFSEQGVRLLMLNVEPPPIGDSKQSAMVELSDGRVLDASLSFSGSLPALQVTYLDPTLALEALEITDPGIGLVGVGIEPSSHKAATRAVSGSSFLDGFRFWLQPARLTAGFAVLLIAALIVFQLAPFTSVSASELLERSAAAEVAQLTNKERVLHRTLDLEELTVTGEVVSRKRIDVWQSSEKGITARRLYDDQGRLVLGDWRTENGIQTIYRRGESAQLRPLPEKRTIGFDDAWQLSLTAKEFISILGGAAEAELETRDSDHRISYTAVEGTASNGIAKAAIVLSKEDLHAIEQTFTLINNGETRDYRMTEAAYEWRLASSVAPAVFEPNLELSREREATSGERSVLLETPSEPDPNAAIAPVVSANLATAALEVEVIDLMNKANAFMGEQVRVERTAGSQIYVEALVETAQRKAELLQALEPVRNNPAVRISIETVAEAQDRVARQKRRTQGQTGIESVDQVQVTKTFSPVYEDLRKKFTEGEAQAFADRVLRRSQQARRHALAAKQLSGRFSIADLQTLSAPDREKWLSLVRSHAARFRTEVDALREDLRVVFPDLAGGGSDLNVGTDAEIQASVGQIYELGVSLDEDLRRSFALLTVSDSSAAVKSAKFWRTLSRASDIAKALQSAR